MGKRLRRNGGMRMLLLALGIAAASAACAQSYPAKPVRVVVPYPAGVGTDIAARYFADAFSRTLGQPFVIDNRAGANGNIGAASAAKSVPDGYTLLAGTGGTHAMNPHLYQPLGFDPEADFEPVGLIAIVPLMIAASASFNVNSIPELIAAAKAKPNSINVATQSVASLITLEYLKQRGGAPLFGVPYKSSTQALTDVAGGRVEVIIDSITAVQPFMAAQKVKALAVTSLRETELLPGVKSVAEQGIAGFEFVGWLAFFAPKGTPQPVISVLNGELTKLFGDPAIRKKVLEFGMQPTAPGTPQEFGQFVRSEREKWGQMIKAGNVKVQ